MKTLKPHETQTPDPFYTEGSDLESETLESTVHNAAVTVPFTAGDFVWAKGKGPIWWPAVVSPEVKNDSVLVSYFGDYDTLAWCEPKQLKPFYKMFDQMSKQSSSISFVRALKSCLEEVEEALELEMTCGCVPLESLPEQVRNGGGSREVPVSSFSPREFVDRIKDAGRDIFASGSLDVLRMRVWVCCFGRLSTKGKMPEYCWRRGMEDLVDKIDLDALPVEMVGGKESEEEALVIALPNRRGGVVDAASDSDEKGEEKKKSLRSKKRKNSKKLEVLKVEDDAFSNAGRRERKKSKYLSPPYTNMREVGKFLATLPKTSDEKGPKKTSSFPEHIDEDDDSKANLMKIERMSAFELLSEISAIAEDSLHLKGNRSEKVIKHFFSVYRTSKYSAGEELEEYEQLVIDSKIEDSDSAATFDGDMEPKFQLEDRKNNRKNRAHPIDDDLDFKQQKSAGLQKLKPRRKDVSKDGSGESSPVSKEVQMEDLFGEGTNKRRGAKKKIGSSHGDTFDLDEGIEIKKLRRNKKNTNYGAQKGSLADFDLDMLDSLVECKGVRRRKSDINGETETMNPFLERASQKKARSCKDSANLEPFKDQISALTCEKKIGSKEDSNNRKNVRNSGVKDAKFLGGKSGFKKTSAAERRKAKRLNANSSKQAALQLSFHSGITLPSAEDLITSYAKYGALIETEIELLQESNSARVVFMNSDDAENAFKDKEGPYASVAAYTLHYLPETHVNHSRASHDSVSSSLQISNVIAPLQQSQDLKSGASKPPLPYIRKSLETMISALAFTSSPVNTAGSSSDGLKPEARDNLVDEMQGLLQKVDKMLNGAGSGFST